MKKLFLMVMAEFCMQTLTACQNFGRMEAVKSLPEYDVAIQKDVLPRIICPIQKYIKTETEAVCRCEHPWQHDFAEYLTDYLPEYVDLTNYEIYLPGMPGIYIGDINSDTIPEIVIDMNGLESTMILYYTGNGVEELPLWTVSTWGNVTYIADMEQILFNPCCAHTTGTFGYAEYYLYDWTGTGYEQTFSLFRESGYYVDEEHYGYGQGFINDVETDFDTFEAQLEEIVRLEEENSYFPVVKFDDEDWESYIKDSFPCFVLPDSENGVKKNVEPE